MANILFKKGDEIYQEVFDRDLKDYRLVSHIDSDTEDVKAMNVTMAFKKSHLKNPRFLGAKVIMFESNDSFAVIRDKKEIIGVVYELKDADVLG